MNGPRCAGLLALATLALLCIALYRHHIAGRTLVGNSDRLSCFLNYRKFHAETLQRGRLQGWNERMFLGLSTFGLHQMFAHSMAWMDSYLPRRDLYRWFGYVSCAWLIVGALASYGFLHAQVGSRFAACVGSTLYVFSSFSVFKHLQGDGWFAVLAHIPLFLWVIRLTRTTNPARSFVVLTLLFVSLFYLCAVQETVYALFLLGAYAVYRGATTGERRVTLVALLALITGTVLAAPRLGTIAIDLGLFLRSNVHQQVHPVELLRLMHDGILGTTAAEAQALNSWWNASEGFQIHTSSFALFAVLAAVVRRADGIWFPLVPARRGECGFFLAVVVVVTLLVLIPPFSRIPYVLFLKRDLSHGRLVSIALLPYCAVAASVLADWLQSGPRARVSTLLPGASAGLLAWGVAAGSRRIAAALDLTGVLSWGRHPTVALSDAACIQSGLEAMLFGALIAMRRRVGGAGVALGVFMAASAFLRADFRANGPQTCTEIPFQAHEFLSARPGDFRIPHEESVRRFRERLETEEYRSVLVADVNEYPAFVSAHLSQFWELRLADGYYNMPRRVALLHWPEGTLSLRALSFPDVQSVPWRLLALLNVKYAVVVNRYLYYNRSGTGREDAQPEDVTIFENPCTVAARQFFVRRVRAAADAEAAAEWVNRRAHAEEMGALSEESVVEGLPGGEYDVSGVIDASYEGDAIVFRFPASPAPRFLVINELYHPSWRAHVAGIEIPLHATNCVMRGVVVPPGTDRIDLVFKPFVRTRGALLSVALGVVVMIASIVLLRRAQR